MSDTKDDKKVNIDLWGVFTTMCGEKFLATCRPDYKSFDTWWEAVRLIDGADTWVRLHHAISFRIELVPQQGGVVRVPFVGGVDLMSYPTTIDVRVCNVYALSRVVGASDKKQYESLIRHALDQMTAARAQRSGLVLP